MFSLNSNSSKSNNKDCSHSVALFPTVVSWAAWKWVNPKVATLLFSIANLERLFITFISLAFIIASPSLIWIKSVLSPTKALVAPKCIIGIAMGACVPNVCTWAITSCLNSFSFFAANS